MTPDDESQSPELSAAAREYYAEHEPLTEAEIERKILRDSSKATLAWVKRGYRLLTTYEGNRLMAQDCFAFAFGWAELTGCETMVELAVKHFQDPEKKETINKCVRMFRDCLGIKKMPGQRDESGRAKMAKARKKQLK